MDQLKLSFKNISFFDPRLKMSWFSRFLIRFVCYLFYTVLFITTATFLFSKIYYLFLIGILFSLFLIDRFIHRAQADRSLVGLIRYLPRLNRRKDNSQLNFSINSAQYLSPSGFSVIERSYDKSILVSGDFYLYLLKFLIHLPDLSRGLEKMDVNIGELEEKIEEIIDSEENKKIKKSKEELFADAGFLVRSAFLAAVSAKNRFIEPRDLFVALGNVKNPSIGKLFVFFNIIPDDLEKAMIFAKFSKGFNFFRRLPKTVGEFISQSKRIRHRTINRAWTSRPTPTLDNLGVDFTDLARENEVGFLIGHETEYARLIDILSRPSRPNALLVGEAGSGKETLVSALAYGIVKDEVPEAIFDKRLVSLGIGNLISGAQPEEVASRLNKIVEEITIAGNIILYIPDIHNLVKTSGSNFMSAANILSPIINNDAFPLIGATYPNEYKQLIEPLSDFSSAFEVIRVKEISEDEAVRLLIYESIILERQYKIIISFGAIKQAVFLAHKYFRQKPLPSSAEDLLKESLSYAASRKDKILQADDVIAVAQRKINIPLQYAGGEEAKKLLNLESIIHESLIDQEAAVSGVSRALREYRSGLSRSGGPIAAFLFVGPTGVGKTELSKILTKVQFGSENLMVRFDMSEYQTKESINRFIGSTDGKISGALTEAIIQKPYSLILLDEFEKAHSDILNLFLQVFDDGRLTDNSGKTVDFSHTIIIATSNAHSNFIKERIEAKDKIEKISEDLKKKLTEYFRPELLNRFSQIVVFKNLSPEDIEEITKLQLKALAKNLEQTHGIILNFNEAVVKYIAELGYDPVFGARPLRGVISEKIRSVLAEKILKVEISKGNSVKAVIDNGEIRYIL
ncbi:MAG: ATPase AAA-2 domain protein [Candidatus Wolfebacteria bacterium GW2011_GWC1_37_10]|uniref:ATPase AAA-2 domain protein n=1 Tax=Candidatus Wolfebacteria bacterium GW2011_GWC1_37_10 TaxID=1619010 RepID=A0A0G0IC97_9BACT|nr:MAG: ATPase AAA-2 domain protein [Candidatus Wolfebacteria bacterium GW2011_GWC1_37_10]